MKTPSFTTYDLLIVSLLITAFALIVFRWLRHGYDVVKRGFGRLFGRLRAEPMTVGLAFVAVTVALVMIGMSSGCATKQVSTVTDLTNSSGVITLMTNTTTEVNAANLALDAGLVQGAVTIGVNIASSKDPAVIPILQDVQTGLTGVLNGASTNSTDQVLAAIGKSGNATLAATIAPVINDASQYEQSLIAKYGTNVAGQISIAFAQAFNAGITAGLPQTK